MCSAAALRDEAGREKEIRGKQGRAGGEAVTVAIHAPDTHPDGAHVLEITSCGLLCGAPRQMMPPAAWLLLQQMTFSFFLIPEKEKIECLIHPEHQECWKVGESEGEIMFKKRLEQMKRLPKCSL